MPLIIKSGALSFKDDDTDEYVGVEVAKGDKGDPGPGVYYNDPYNDGNVIITRE